MNCGHSDVLGKIDLKRRETTACARGAGGAESVEMCTKCNGICGSDMVDDSVTLGAPSVPFLVD